MERLMEETGQSFVETYHRRVFVPAMQYMLSRFVQAQSTVMSREVAPGSIRVFFSLPNRQNKYVP